jgi:conjugative relaxase-like TrwC/TraI family protein
MRYLEQSAARARPGKDGAVCEPTAGLLMAALDHHTSRELDPQLHTPNLAPRKDGTWDALTAGAASADKAASRCSARSRLGGALTTFTAAKSERAIGARRN